MRPALLSLAFALVASPTFAHETPPQEATPASPSEPAIAFTDPRGAEGLRVDLERIISSEESSGWFLDASHYESIRETVLQSVCRATEPALAEARARLGVESSVAGDPRVVFEREGRVTSAVEVALHLERMRVALERARRSDCPFWVVAGASYAGRQTDAQRFTLNGEIGTLVALRYSSSRFTAGASPSIRTLAGYTFGRLGLLAGLEFSGGPMLHEDDSSKLVLNYFPAVPVVMRIRHNNWIYSLETGLVSVLQGDDTRMSFGVRGGGGIGLMALRTRWFIPWAGAALYYEHYFAGPRPPAEFLRGGLRIGIIFDP